MSEYTDKQFWDSYFQKKQTGKQIPFTELFNDFFKPDPQKSILEIGCAGGEFLAYFAEHFGYKAHGVDFSDEITQTRAKFTAANLLEPVLHKVDFFTWQAPQQFDIVCSFGFVEHFDNFAQVVQRHAELVKPGGYLIITMPHFAHGQYLFHWLLDHGNLKRHNTKIMNRTALRNALADLPFSIQYLDYYKTFGFWTERKDLSLIEQAVQWAIKKFGKVIQVTFGYDRPNFLFSPHLVCIAQRTS